MQVKLKAALSGPAGSFDAGAVIDVPAEEAKRLVARNLAEGDVKLSDAERRALASGRVQTASIQHYPDGSEAACLTRPVGRSPGRKPAPFKLPPVEQVPFPEEE